MIAHVILLFLSFLNGGYMLANGLHVIFKGKYIGSSKPGQWAAIMYKLEVNVFKLGPLFVSFGVLWLLFMGGLWLGFS